MRLDELLSEKGKNCFYIMHLSYDGSDKERLWDYAKENNIIGLDYPDEVKDAWNRIEDSVKDRLPRIWVKQFNMFCDNVEMAGAIVVILEGWHSLLGIAEVSLKPYIYKRGLCEKEIFFDHIREVKWRSKYNYGKHPKLLHPVTGFRNTLSRVEHGTKRWLILSPITI